MKKIKIYFTDFWEGFQCNDNFIYNCLKDLYDIEISSDNPDYLFYSVFGIEFARYDCVRIFYTGENVRPNFNLCDYGIGFDYMHFQDRYFRYPLWCLYFNEKTMVRDKNLRPVNDGRREKFCNFIYSNSDARTRRDEFFWKLSEYRKVDSGGGHLNNIGKRVENKLAWISNFKFTIAFENAVTPGYTTEKIIQAFAANTIPIYYGDPKIEKQFNPNAFVNVQKYRDFDEAVNKIVQLDRNKDAYMEMLNQQVIKDNCMENLDKMFKEFLVHVMEQDKIKAIRRVKYGAEAREERRVKRLLESR